MKRFDKLLKQLGQTLTDDAGRKRFLVKLWRGLRRLLLWSTVAYALSLVVAVLALRWIGERNLTFAFVLFLPRVGFLLPLPFLILPSLIFHWRLLPLQLAIAPLFMVFGMGWQFGSRPELPAAVTAPPELRVLTYNRGQHANQSLQPFKSLTKPDIIVFQEAGKRAARYAADDAYREFGYTADEGEFTVLSRYPIISSRLFETQVEGQTRQPMARFELDFAGKKIALFCIHPRSPRDILLYYRRGAFLYGIIGIPGTPLGEKRKINQTYWDGRIGLVEELLEEIKSEPLPVIVAGDLNAPAGGYIHHLIEQQLTDTHEAAGRGYGYTFPGTTRNPLSLGGPWIRLDYVLHDRHWQTIDCVTEPTRPSQHRAVTATLRLRPDASDN